MPVVAFTALWLAASTPAATAPTAESSEPPATATVHPPKAHDKPNASQPRATTVKKTGSDKDEPGCEE